tara:strand:+ start:10742 stop:11518 length:777 start_codon:yes stop_codon:yes gene_type:complete
MGGTWADNAFTYRQPISIPVFVTGGGGATNVDVQVQIPPDWDVFWNNIQANFFDIKVYTANGEAAINYQRQTGANFANRNLTLELDAVAVDDQSSTSLVYLYFGDSGASSDPSSSVTISSAVTGTIWIGRPVRLVQPSLNNSGRTEPEVVFTKQANEIIDIWFDVRSLLSSYIDPFNGRFGYEAIQRIQPKSLDSSGSDNDSRYSSADTFFLNGYASIRAKGGSSGTDYAVGLDIFTTIGQTIKVRCLLKVQNLLPSS